MTFIDELEWRGLLQDIIPGTKEHLEKGMVKAYVGFDPTGDSLHIGSLVPIILLMHLQRAGHKPYALVGGATGMIGDPSGKSEERNLLTIEEIHHNQLGIQQQLSHFLDFASGKENEAVMLNNYDWFQQISFLDFARDIGKHITVNYMLSKDSVKKRLETGMSFTEFTYQLIQGYDFYHLHQTVGISLQMGGSDQWGNIVTGTELIRRKAQGEAYAFTAPLIKKADGGKFGKTEAGNVWLDRNKTSPYRFYQFWLNTTDEDAEKYIKIFTFLPQDEIQQLISEHRAMPHLRNLQKVLAAEVTTMVHSAEDVDFAVKASQILFGKNTAEDLLSLDEATLLDIMDGVPQIDIEGKVVAAGLDIITFLTDTKIYTSKSEARKMTASGAVSVNKTKVNDIAFNIDDKCLLADKFILVQKGKKHYYLIRTI